MRWSSVHSRTTSRDDVGACSSSKKLLRSGDTAHRSGSGSGIPSWKRDETTRPNDVPPGVAGNASTAGSGRAGGGEVTTTPGRATIGLSPAGGQPVAQSPTTSKPHEWRAVRMEVRRGRRANRRARGKWRSQSATTGLPLCRRTTPGASAKRGCSLVSDVVGLGRGCVTTGSCAPQNPSPHLAPLRGARRGELQSASTCPAQGVPAQALELACGRPVACGQSAPALRSPWHPCPAGTSTQRSLSSTTKERRGQPRPATLPNELSEKRTP